MKFLDPSIKCFTQLPYSFEDYLEKYSKRGVLVEEYKDGKVISRQTIIPKLDDDLSEKGEGESV